MAQTPYGRIEFLPFDGPIGDSLALYGEWAGREIGFLQAFVPQGATVVDGGANIGTHTLAFARFCGSGGSVIAVEASPELAALLQRNVGLNQLPNVTVVTAALGRDGGAVQIPRLDPARRQNAGGLKVGAGERAGTFALHTEGLRLDSLDLARLDLLKLDIEGGEFTALEGGMGTIARCRPAIYLEMLSLDAAAQILQLMRPLNYKPFLCTFAAYNPDNAARNAENVFGPAREAALLLIGDAAVLPPSAPGAEIHAVTSLEQLARLFAEMPRYGDEGEHDRVVTRLWAQRAALRAQLGAAAAEPKRDGSGQAEPPASEQAASGAPAETAAEREGAMKEQAEALIRLKAEVATLRGALLGRNQDRAAMVLALEEVRAEAQHASATAEAAQLVSEALDRRIGDLGTEVERATQASSLTAAETPRLAYRLERVELTARRFELFYDSAPVRGLRRLYLRLRGARPSS